MLLVQAFADKCRRHHSEGSKVVTSVLGASDVVNEATTDIKASGIEAVVVNAVVLLEVVDHVSCEL